VAPILLEFWPRDLLTPLYDNASGVLHEAGVPVEVHALILDGLETLTIGAALMQASKSPETRQVLFASLDRETNRTGRGGETPTRGQIPRRCSANCCVRSWWARVEALDRSGF